MRRQIVASVILVSAAIAVHLSAAMGETAAEFYKDKQIRIIVGNPAGGDYDQGGRMLAKYLAAHMPGNPTIIVQNMPGAATITAANYLYAKAPRDGTVLGSFSRNIPSQAVIGQKNLEADPRKFGWVGGSSLPSRICAVSGQSPVKSPDELFTRELIVAGSGAGSSLSIVPTVLSNVLGMKFKIVEGYPGTNAAVLALERGEVEGVCHTYGLFQTTHARLVKEGQVRILMHVEEAAFPDDPSVPSVYDFAKTESQKQLLRFLFSSVEFGRPYVAPPGVPPERLAALRQAFAAALNDPALIDEAKKTSIDMTYRPPQELEKLVQALYATPSELIQEAEKIMPAGGMN
jgi:tripartite-type tricarboxylate transporter receptor subunit TctC